MMQLFHASASPFVRKVMVVLHETGQLGDVEIRPAVVAPVTTGDAALQHNPLGKIPALIRDDGPALYDSRVICRYFDERASAGLYPASRLWEVLTLEATADGLMDAAVLMVYETRFRDEGARSQPWIDGQWGKITRALDALGEIWLSHLKGAHLDAGQIATACALGYLDFRHPDHPWRDGRPDLAAWYAGFSARPSMAATVPS